MSGAPLVITLSALCPRTTPNHGIRRITGQHGTAARVTPPLHLPSTPLTADLPATGRSSPTSATRGTWLAAALAAARTTAAPVLVGPSLGAATILEHLAAGGQARAVVLISPFLRDVTMSPPASTR
jgi:pimeloyl-ACP methyl ester carboxylesterase